MTVRPSAIPASAKALVAILFAALFFFGVQAPAASAAPISSLTVAPTTKTGAPITGLHVYAYQVEDHTILDQGVEATPLFGADAGTYEFSAADGNALDDALDYTFYFDAPYSVTTAFDQFLGGTTWVEEAETWSYTGQDRISLTLATNSSVTGKVTGASSKPLSGVTVYPYRFDGNDWFLVPGAKAVTTSAGMYTMRNLEPGTYRLEFAPDNRTGYLGEFSGNKTDFDDAAAITLGLGSTITHNASLVKGGSISGTVNLYFGGVKTPPFGITAFAYPVHLPDEAIDTDYVYASKVTTTSGKWTVSGLPVGDYKVKLYDTDTFAFVDKWAGPTGGTDTSMDPDTKIYHVSAGKATTASGITRLDFFDDFTDRTSLTLTVEDANGDPLGDDSLLYIESTSGEDFFYASDPDDPFDGWSGGVLDVAFMPVGDYRLWIDPRDGLSQPYVEEGWSIAAQPGGNTWSIELDPVSPFTYDTPPTIAETGTKTGTQYEVDRGITSLDDGSGVEADVEYTYIWLRQDAPIFGALSSEDEDYITRGADVGSKVSVIVQADAFGYPTVFQTVTAADPVTIGDAPVNTAQAYVDGPSSPVPGSVLKANPGEWDQQGLSYTYQWTLDGADIPLATERAYTVKPTDAGHSIGFKIQAHKTGYGDSAVVDSSNQPIIGYLPALRATRAPAYRAVTSGSDVLLSTTAGTWSPSGTAYMYDWYVDGVLEHSDSTSGATAGFTCISCTGKAIELTVNAYRDGYNTGIKHYVVRKSTADPLLDVPAVITDETAGGAPVAGGDVAQFGHTLKAAPQSYLYDGPGGTLRYSYQWLRNGSAISKATKQTYVPLKSDLNKVLTVRITVTSTLYKTASAVAPAGTIGNKLDLVNGAKPTVYVDGSYLVGYTKKARVEGTWALSGVTLKYQWYVCIEGNDCGDTSSPDYVAVPGATSATFVPSTPGPDLFILVEVTGSKSGYAPAKTRSGSLELDHTGGVDNFVFFTFPKYLSGITSGNAVKGKPIKVSTATIDRPADATHTSEWVICPDSNCVTTAPIPGATGTTYTPTADLFDGGEHWIRYIDRWTVGSITNEAVTDTVKLTPASWKPTVAPKLASTTVNPTLRHYTVTPGTWPAGTAPSSFTYEWYENTTMVSSLPSYDTAPSGSSPAWVKVTAQRPGYVDNVFFLVIHKGLLPAQTVNLAGSSYGDTLSLAAPISLPVNAPAAKFTYQWYSGSTKISGATKSTYKPPASLVGKSIRVKVTPVSGYYSVTAPYTSTAVVLAPHAASPAVPTVKSTPNTFTPGSKLTVGLTGYPSSSAFTYQWQRSTDGGSTWSTIWTKSSYTLTTSDPGPDNVIRIVVTHKKSGWTTSTTPSLGWIINPTDNIEATSGFELVGSAKVDTTIGAPISWNTKSVTVSYQWLRNGVLIPGATSSSVTPTASWFGDDIQAIVTAKKPGWTTKTVSSDVVQVQLGDAPTSSPLTTNPAVPQAGQPMTMSSGVWSVAGVTLSYGWYADEDLTSLVSSSPTFVPGGAGHIWAVVTAQRAGYADGIVVKDVTVVAP